jgi:hypothetical protein
MKSLDRHTAKLLDETLEALEMSLGHGRQWLNRQPIRWQDGPQGAAYTEWLAGIERAAQALRNVHWDAP